MRSSSLFEHSFQIISPIRYQAFTKKCKKLEKKAKRPKSDESSRKMLEK